MTDAERLDPTEVPAPGGALTTATDPELILRVRAGDTGAYEELFVRHRPVAIRYARRISDAERAEDLCAEAFAKIFDLLQRGKGPDVAFRAYLLTTVRTSHLNAVRAGSREELVPDHEPRSRMTPVTEDPDLRFDRGAICRAFYQLPGRWQSALWLTEVEGLSNGEAGRHLGISANAVASLSFRARVGLRQAFLAEHLLETTDPICRRIVELLPSHRRGTLTARRRVQVDRHLETCRSCTAAALELNHVDTGLGAVIGPAALTGFTLGGATVVHAPGTALGTAVAAKAAAPIGHAKAWGAGAPAVSVAKVAVIASVAAVGVAVGSDTLMNHPSHERAPRAPNAVRATPAGRSTVQPRPDALPPSAPVLVAAGDGPRSTIPLPPEVTAPTPSVAPMPMPSSPPPSSPPPPPSEQPPSEPPAPSQRATAVGPMTSSRFQRNLAQWNRVTVPVSDPAQDSALRLTTNRTINAALITDTTSGWICGVPTLDWLDGDPYATSVTECRYNGHGDGSPLEIEYQVGSGSRLTAALTPPAGVSDTSLTDNLATLDLRA